MAVQLRVRRHGITDRIEHLFDSARAGSLGQTPGMAIELVPLRTATLTLAEPFVIPEGPAGTRVIIEVEDFVVEGERIKAKQKGKAGADWLSIDAAPLTTMGLCTNAG